MSKYTKEEVIKKLQNLKIKVGMTIEIPKRAHVGIKCWGMIDYLGLPWVRMEK